MGTTYTGNFLRFTFSTVCNFPHLPPRYGISYEVAREACQQGTPGPVFELLRPQYTTVALEHVSVLDTVEPSGHLLNIPPNPVGSAFKKTKQNNKNPNPNHKIYTLSPPDMGKI